MNKPLIGGRRPNIEALARLERAIYMITLVRTKWPDAEAVRILDLHELDNAAKPCEQCLLQILQYEDGEYVDLGFPVATITRLVHFVRVDLRCDGAIRMAVAERKT